VNRVVCTVLKSSAVNKLGLLRQVLNLSTLMLHGLDYVFAMDMQHTCFRLTV